MFQRQTIPNVDIVDFAIRYVYDSVHGGFHLQKRMKLDGTLASPELGPREEGKVYVDSDGVEGIDGFHQIDIVGEACRRTAGLPSSSF